MYLHVLNAFATLLMHLQYRKCNYNTINTYKNVIAMIFPILLRRYVCLYPWQKVRPKVIRIGQSLSNVFAMMQMRSRRRIWVCSIANAFKTLQIDKKKWSLQFLQCLCGIWIANAFKSCNRKPLECVLGSS